MAGARSVGSACRQEVPVSLLGANGPAVVRNEHQCRERRGDEHADTGRLEHPRGFRDDEQGLIGVADGRAGIAGEVMRTCAPSGVPLNIIDERNSRARRPL